jgi:LmbE family N-acetylglucosaminyl deacetylase
MLNPNLTRSLLSILLSFITFCSFSQSIPSSELYHELLKIQETRRVLYIAAHPDDENTRLIAYLANQEMVQVAYMALTRGDGGQNLIGPELGIGLGQIRTQELLKARETDGGRQFFSRAKDFGYSKNPTETLQNWDKNTILSDVVWVIRKFRPDIIITRFNTIPGGGNHGHHTTSAILAEEALTLAGDPNSFPEQLKFVETWSPKRIFWNTYNFRGDFEPEEGKQYYAFPTGDYNSLLGETYSQIASDSRTMHKSQGFGSTASIGGALDHIQFIKGEPMVENPFEGVKDRWQTVAGGKEIEELVQKALDKFDFVEPSSNVANLLEIKKKLNALNTSETWLTEKKVALDRLIVNALGIDFEYDVNQETGYPGSEVATRFVFNNPSNSQVSDLKFEVKGHSYGTKTAVESNQPVTIPIQLKIAENEPYSQPYWLKDYVDGPMYPIKDQEMIGKPFNDIQIGGQMEFQISGQKFSLPVQLFYKYNDQVDGEVKQPFTIIPEVDLKVSKNTLFLLGGTDPKVTVSVHFNGEMLDGELSFSGIGKDQYRILEVDDIPAQNTRVYHVEFLKNGDGKKIVTAQYQVVNGKKFDQVMNQISYKHIPNLTYFQPANIGVIQADWKVSGDRIGYIPGAGDEVPAVLEALGYQIVPIGENDYNLNYLSQFKTIIVGIRAYNVNKTLSDNQQIIMGYVKAGGHLIVQYNTSAPLLVDQLGPYPFNITRDRVSVESAPIDADFTHPLLVGPNPINQDDFKDWIQERGLYFAGNLAPEYSTPFTMNDPEEDPKTGSLIYANYGEGTYVYSGLSFFRELPAGVPGAIKLFINLIEQ